MGDQNNQQQRPSDGGPAFPADWFNEETGHREEVPGMSLRDYFAAKALSGWLSNPECNGDNHTLARGAYDLADAMLKARETVSN